MKGFGVAGLRLTVVEAFDIPDAWHRCLELCLKDGYEYTVQRGSFVGHKRKELDSVLIYIKRPGNLPLVPEVPQGVPPPTDMEYVNRYLAYLFTPEKKEGEEYTYGERLTGTGVNQVEEAIKILRETPETNQACMEIGMPSDILLSDPPCIRLIDCRVRYGALHFHIYLRSWDAWGGLPANLAALQLLKEYMAKKIGVEDGSLSAWSKGLHIYSHHYRWAEMVLNQKTERIWHRKWLI